MIKNIRDWLVMRWAHFVIWSVFIIYETIIVGLIFNVYANPVTYIFHYFVIIVCFYTFSDVGLPWALRVKSFIWWRIPVILFLDLGLYIYVQYLCDLMLIWIDIITVEKAYILDRQFVLKNLFRGIYFVLFATGYFLYKIRERERKEKEDLKRINFENVIKSQQVERQLVEMRNSFLKAQINPHFLFNTLDFIYHTMRTDTDVASDAVIYLSKVMRFAIDSDKHGDFVLIEDEVRHARTLFLLYNLRKRDSKLPIIECESEIASGKFIPLVILTLAENMIKYADLSSQINTAFIKISISEDNFQLQTENIALPVPEANSGQTGLKNIKERLIYTYGESVNFEYGTKNNIFELLITIPMVVIRAI